MHGLIQELTDLQLSSIPSMSSREVARNSCEQVTSRVTSKWRLHRPLLERQYQSLAFYLKVSLMCAAGSPPPATTPEEALVSVWSIKRFRLILRHTNSIHAPIGPSAAERAEDKASELPPVA
jgi:hypothetical protein